MNWMSLVSSAIDGSKKGAHDPYGTPDINPALDPGMYAFQMQFNKQRREEAEREKAKMFNEDKRQFDVRAGQSAIGQLASMRNDAQKNAVRQFRNILLK